MQTFVQKHTPAPQTFANNLRQKPDSHDQAAAGGTGLESAPLLGAALESAPRQEIRQALNTSRQAKSVANYQNLFDNSPRVVAQAKFQNILNNPREISQVAQLKPAGTDSTAVVQRNGDPDDRRKRLFWAGAGAYFGGTRAWLKESADPVRRYGAEQAAEGLGGFGHYVKSINMMHYLSHMRHPGPLRTLSITPFLAAALYFASKYGSKKEEN